MISTNLQEMSLEYDILQWNKRKQIICILKKNNCFTKILGITSVVWTITQQFWSYVTIFSHFEGCKELPLSRIKPWNDSVLGKKHLRQEQLKRNEDNANINKDLTRTPIYELKKYWANRDVAL